MPKKQPISLIWEYNYIKYIFSNKIYMKVIITERKRYYIIYIINNKCIKKLW